MKIAIFVDKYGTVLPFFSSGVVEIYSDISGGWKCSHQVPLDLSSEPGMYEVLKAVRMLVSELDGCNLLVIENVKGIAASYLSDFRMGIWKFKGIFNEDNLLNHIRKEVEKAISEQKQNQVTATPVPFGKEEDSVYELDLATMLDCDASLSSRAILITFFQNTAFRELIIICRQSPKWLEQSMELLQLSQVFDDMGDGLLCLTITPKDFVSGLEIRKAVHPDKISNQEDACLSSACVGTGSCATVISKEQLVNKTMQISI